MTFVPDAVRALDRTLRDIFGDRLQSVVVYGPAERMARTLAIVNTLSAEDLRACTVRVAAWHDAGLATPLLIAADEFGRSLDAFPFEFGAILRDHVVVSGSDPFAGLSVNPADLRRACEVQARGHLLHLREGYLETRGRNDALALLVANSAGAFAALLTSVARLVDPGNADTHDATSAARQLERMLGPAGHAASEVVALAGVSRISSSQAERLFPPYLDAVERLVKYIDTWKQREM
jgi:hypothetical protein